MLNETPYIRFCPKCGKKLFYQSLKSKRKRDKKNSVCNACVNLVIPIPPKPWIKKCMDCPEEVRFENKYRFLSNRPCRCERCLRVWRSKVIASKQFQIKKSGYKYKLYTFPDGRTEMVQGYEPYTLNYLISSSISSNDIRIKQSEKPKIDYEFDEIKRPYIPDAYISSNNTVIETKSSWTWKSTLERNLAKIEGTTNAGYNMRIIIWKDNKKLISDITYPSKLE